MSIEELRLRADELGWSAATLKRLESERFGEAFVLSEPKHGSELDSFSQHLTHSIGPKNRDDVLRSIQRIMNKIQFSNSAIEHQHRPGYGLVIGRIQSGKTAHIIALTAAWMDMHIHDKKPPIVIVLSGLIQSLRDQTYNRFTKPGFDFVTIPETDDISTSSEQNVTDLREALRTPHPLTLVCKKNHLVIQCLQSILSEEPSLSNRVLIIDDECDHASIDSTHSEDEYGTSDDDITATNHALRSLLKVANAHTRAWYVGFTATPYCNLLMRANPEHLVPELGLSLFPRDFIFVLPKPRGHYDNENFLQKKNDFFREFETPEPDSKEETEHLTDMLALHVSTRLLRFGHGPMDHHTSMVHTSTEIAEHIRLTEALDSIKDTVTSNIELFADRCLRLVEREFPSLVADFQSQLQRLESEISSSLISEVYNVSIVMLNSEDVDDEQLISTEISFDGPKPFNGIVVGGHKLSRGLTLEGLVVSWYARSSQQPKYDTVLQAARWCGFRDQELRFIRVFLPADALESYEYINRVEQELRIRFRSELPNDDHVVWLTERRGMLLSGKLPDDVIRSSSSTTALPSRFWVRNPFICPNFGDRFDTQLRFLNNDITKKLLGWMSDSVTIGNYRQFSEVSGNEVRDLLKSYFDFGETQLDGFNLSMLLDGPMNNEESFAQDDWDVALFSPVEGDASDGIPLSTSLTSKNSVVQCIRQDHRAKIGRVSGVRVRPLLVIEFLDSKLSKAVELDVQANYPLPFFEIHLPQTIHNTGTVDVAPPDAFTRSDHE